MSVESACNEAFFVPSMIQKTREVEAAGYVEEIRMVAPVIRPSIALYWATCLWNSLISMKTISEIDYPFYKLGGKQL